MKNLGPVEEEDSPVLDTVALNCMIAATIAATLRATRKNLIIKEEDEELIDSKSSEKTKQ
jgi:hypothetical protein